MLDATHKIYSRYGIEERRRTKELAQKTTEQLLTQYLETVFTAAIRRRLDIWDFVQKFMSSEFSFALDRPETLYALHESEIFRDFTIFASRNDIELLEIEGSKRGMSAFREITPEAKWIAQLYSKWHSKNGDALCEIAERAPSSLLRKISRKAMEHDTDEVIELLVNYTKDKALITGADYNILEAETDEI